MRKIPVLIAAIVPLVASNASAVDPGELYRSTIPEDKNLDADGPSR